MSVRAWLTIALAALLPLAAEADPADDRLRRLAAEARQEPPLMRIGLEPGSSITIASAKPYRLIDPATGSDVWRERFQGQVQVLVEGVDLEGSAPVFRVQAGAYSTEAAANQELARLQAIAGTRGTLHRDVDRGQWRVRLGTAPDRESLAPVLEKLRLAGVEGLWIAEEPAATPAGASLRLVDERYASSATSLTRIALVPALGATTRVGEKSYRGIVELRVGAGGVVRPINWIGLEAYLQGVVPAELGPEVWPQLAALEAQAVAARTYAWRNRKQFDGEGFDLCATPRCQVYEGRDAEHPLSDRAVASTRGRILVHAGRPIDALYTATCGGHTEAGDEIFPGEPRPYLRGVPCRAEGEAIHEQRVVLDGRAPATVIDETGADVTRDWTLLVAAGVIPADQGSVQAAAAPFDGLRLRQWARTLSRSSGRPEPSGPPPVAERLGQLAAAFVDDLGWTARGEVLLAIEDLPALLRDPEALSLPERERRALAYLASIEALRPFSDGRFGVLERPTAARLAPVFARHAERYAALGLSSGVLAGRSRSGLRLVQGKQEVRLPVAPQPWLLGLSAGRSVAVASLTLWPGDRVQWRTGAGGAIELLELQPPVKGTSDDRSARVYSWEERKTRRELEATINRRISVGQLRDLRVLRRGVSGRIVELEVEGSSGSSIVRGFDVRRLFDLRESLLVFELQRDSAGELTAVTFAGKGWGHGVGMCQVGAYGMALRGADHSTILGHYYPGTALVAIDEKSH